MMLKAICLTLLCSLQVLNAGLPQCRAGTQEADREERLINLVRMMLYGEASVEACTPANSRRSCIKDSDCCTTPCTPRCQDRGYTYSYCMHPPASEQKSDSHIKKEFERLMNDISREN